MAVRPLILGYHAISAAWPSGLAVPEATFAAQLRTLHGRGYVGLTLSDAEAKRRAGTLPDRSLVVTFDDGYASTLRARPILEAFEYPATVFVVTSFLDGGRPLSWPGIDGSGSDESAGELEPLGWDDLAELESAGWEIGSHTVRHPLLTRLDDDSLAEELRLSRATLCERLGRCSAIAYPYGLADVRVARAAAAAGYEVGVTLTWTEFADEPLRRPRVGIDRDDAGLRLALKVSLAGRAVRRSPVARLARRVPRARRWLPA